MKVPNLPEFLPIEIKEAIKKDAENVNKKTNTEEVYFSYEEEIDEGTFLERLIKTFKDLYN